MARINTAYALTHFSHLTVYWNVTTTVTFNVANQIAELRIAHTPIGQASRLHYTMQKYEKSLLLCEE